MKPAACFENRIVWITGASSGIGEALALRLASHGATLILSSNEPEALDRVKAACLGLGARADARFLDLSRPETMAPAAAEVLAKIGRVDVLVNNGGISQRARAGDTPLEIDRRIMEIDYFGHIALTKALLPSMLRRRDGHIVVTTSVMGLICAPLRSAYCAAKHALHGFFETLRYEVWKENIRVTVIAPAAVKTRIAHNALTAAGKRHNRPDKLVEAGITAERCAAIIERAIVRKKERVVIGQGLGKWGVTVDRCWPGLYSWLVKRQDIG